MNIKAQVKLTSVAFVVLLAAYGLYAVAFIYKTSVLITPNSYVHETKRYYVLFDDAMISMRYARNLVDGYGLVWNPGGERVEGFTNPLWTAWMALVHVVEKDAARTSLYVQLSGMALLLANVWVTYRLTERLSGNTWAALGAAAFTAFYLPLNAWGLLGMEVSALALIVSLAAWGGLEMLERGRPLRWPYVLLGFSVLVRMDMAVPLVFLALFMVAADRAHWRKHAAWAGGALAFSLGLQTAFRRWYYHAWLPNTYYLKVGHSPLWPRVKTGLMRDYYFLSHATPLPFLALILRASREVLLLGWLVGGQLLYSAWVGGDAWEWFGGANRYLCVSVSLLFVLLWVFFRELAAWVTAHRPTRQRVLARVGLGILVAALFLHYNAPHGVEAWEEWTLHKPLRLADEHPQRVYGALLLDALTTPNATVAVTWAGIIPYFTERPYVDLLGKNDAYIAHLPVRFLDPWFLPGHMKWDYAYSIGQLKPDVVLELWRRSEEAMPYLSEDYLPIWFPPLNANIWMRKDSPHILWERLGM